MVLQAHKTSYMIKHARGKTFAVHQQSYHYVGKTFAAC